MISASMPTTMIKIYDSTTSTTATTITCTYAFKKDRPYLIYLLGVAATGNNNYFLYINGNTTKTDYYNQTITSAAAVTTSATANTCQIGSFYNGYNTLMYGVFFHNSITTKPTFTFLNTHQKSASATDFINGNIFVKNAIADVTSIQLTSDLANNFAAGTRLIIYEGI